MKKLICIIMILCMTPVISLADMDLGSMNFDDLIALQKKIVAEIVSRPEWKEVEVPSGQWIVGVDIPAGVYSVSPVRSSSSFSCYDQSGRLTESLLCLSDSPIGKIELIEGWTVNLTNPVIFAPPLALGF